MPRLKIGITKGSVLKIVPKATFFALISFCCDKRCHLCALELKVCEKSGTLSAFYVNRDTTGTNAKIPGLSRSFWDTWQLCIYIYQQQSSLNKIYRFREIICHNFCWGKGGLGASVPAPGLVKVRGVRNS